MESNLPLEEREDLDRIAEEIARVAMIMLSQQVEQRATRLGMDLLAKTYLAEQVFIELLGYTSVDGYDD